MNAQTVFDNSSFELAFSAPVEQLTDDDLRVLFDQNSRYFLGITGEDFQHRWSSGRLSEIADPGLREVVEIVVDLLPLVQHDDCDHARLHGLIDVARQVPGGRILTHDEAWNLFDQNARYYMGMSGDEFKRRWDAGEYYHNDDMPNHNAIINVRMMMAHVDERFRVP